MLRCGHGNNTAAWSWMIASCDVFAITGDVLSLKSKLNEHTVDNFKEHFQRNKIRLLGCNVPRVVR